MSEQQGETNEEEEVHYHHDFSEDELNMMLFQWDDEAYPVKEYHYMKEEWKTPDAIVGADPSAIKNKDKNKPIVIQDKPNLRGEAHDEGHRTVVDLNKAAPPGETPIPLANLNTQTAVHIVEFYQPWCGHCQTNKPHYIAVARETTRRSIGIPVQFHAVSCQLYREVCRAYDIVGFPFMYGWGIGTDIAAHGVELNPGGFAISADRVARELGLTLASEKRAVSVKNVTASAADDEAKSLAAMEKKKTKLEYSTALNDRYHNSAVSLAFVLDTAVFVERSNDLDDTRALALHEFLQLVYWATPQSWSVRTGMVEQILQQLGAILTTGGPALLSSIVREHQQMTTTTGSLWGDIERKRKLGETMGLGVDVPHHHRKEDEIDLKELTKEEQRDLIRANNRWTSACTHDERGMGFTCGLWELLHIITIGTSIPAHRMFAFRLGYHAEPKQVAEIIKRFLQHFFSCDVCRWNFLDLYDRCGHDHCTRLIDSMPELMELPALTAEVGDNDVNATIKTQQKQQEAGRQLSLWLWEVHNSINVRLMREAATRQDRTITEAEKLAAVFPTHKQCPTCWLKDDMSEHDPDQVFAFLQRTYWPVYERSDNQFKSILKQKLVNRQLVTSTIERWDSWWFVIGPLALGLGFLLRRALEKRANTSNRKNV